MLFSFDLAFRLATTASYFKGEEYFTDGAVIKLWKEDEQYLAAVQGTQLYTVTITTRAENVQTNCTCPYEGEGVCKHVVAAILAFSKDPQFAKTNFPQKEDTKEYAAEQVVTVLLNQASDVQVRKFFKTLLVNDPQVVNDFSIFLQGSKETTATIELYQQHITAQLDVLDFDELQAAWYYSGEDNYENYGHGGRYDDDTIAGIVNPYREEARKYSDNKNYGESSKIYQAVIEALRKKDQAIQNSHPDITDWFTDEINKTMHAYMIMLTDMDDVRMKKIGIQYLCSLFEHEQLQWDQVELGKGIQNSVSNQREAKMTLQILSRLTEKKTCTPPESSLLAHLYFLATDYAAFEKLILDNLEQNPGLTIKLFQLYTIQKRKSDILKTAERVLTYLHTRSMRESFNFSYFGYEPNIEIQIREFLKTIFNPKTEYAEIVKNLEQLFLVSARLRDYQELTQVHTIPHEKEAFLKNMKLYFTKENNVKILFKVFKLEDKKAEILELIKKYPDEDCFSDMITVISETYPQECFASYTKKITHLLKDANVKIYPQVAYHLKRLRRIGITTEFNTFIHWVTATYSRRRCLMEELKKAHLI